MRLRLPSAIKAGLLQTSAHFWKITHGSVLVRATVQALWLNTACLWERASAREGVLRSWCTNYKVDVFCVTPHKTRRAYLKHACSAHLLIIQGFHHGYPQNFFHRGGNVNILLILFKLLTMQCKWMFTKRFTMGGGRFSKVGGTSPHQKNYTKILWFELATVTSQALKKPKHT